MRSRSSTPLLLSIGAHVVLGIALASVVFHYDFSVRSPRAPAAPVEQITYVAVGAGGGAMRGTAAGAPAKSTVPSAGRIAPVRVPTAVVPPSAAVGGTPGGVVGGTAAGGGIGPTTGVVPADPDPRLTADAHQFFPVPKTHAERVDSAVKATIYAFSDSVARAHSAEGRKPGDWTFEKGGQKWGIDGNKIYLGKFAIPSAVLAALPIRIQGNPGEGFTDRLAPTRHGDIEVHAASAFHDDEFKTAVRRIRERKDRERRERLNGTEELPVAAPDEGH